MMVMRKEAGKGEITMKIKEFKCFLLEDISRGAERNEPC